MDITRKEDIKDYVLGKDMDLIGIADPSLFDAPPGHNPKDILAGCRSVIIFAKTMPKGIFEALNNRYDLYMHAYERYFAIMDDLASVIAGKLEEAGFLSIPIPSCTPLHRKDGWIRGILSLKHAARIAGMGAMGKNYLLINERYGTRLRLGGVLTTAEIEPDNPFKDSFCEDDCQICLDACPARAIKLDKFDQPRCFSHAVAHPLLKASAITRFLPRWLQGDSFSQLVTNTLGRPFRVECIECLIQCPKYQVS
jgi:epoxyqueuosine reductase QueG